MHERELEVQGFVAPGYEAVKAAFAENLRGEEAGASFAVYRAGEPVVDLWGGHSDIAGAVATREDTLFNLWSTTKGLAAISVALLVERRLVGYDVPVAEYWPAFGAAGKAAITVGQLMSHQAGLVGPRIPTTLEDYFAHDRLAAELAAQAPFFAPGRWGYHTLTYGTLADELVRRVDGRRIGAFFGEEIARPAGLDLFMGLPQAEDHRQAETIVTTPTGPFFDAPDQDCFTAALLNPMLDWSWPNRRDWRAHGLAAAGGSGNARGLAKLYGIVANGGTVGNDRLLSPDTIGQASVERIGGVDQSSGGTGRYAAGFRLNTGTMGSNPFAFGHAGLGRSTGFADPARALGVGYAMNRLLAPAWQSADPRLAALLVALYQVDT